MTEEEVRKEIKTPAVLEAFERARYDKLPSEVREQYALQDKDYDRISEYTKSEKAKGKAEGLVEGKAEEKTKTAKKMHAREFSLEDIVECTGLTIEEITKIIGRVNKTN